MRFVWLVVAVVALEPSVLRNPGICDEKATEIRWKQHTINDQSPYEACGAADFNGDGKIDIFCGDSWYEAAGILIHGRDVDGDKLTDVIWGMGHDFGLYWLKQSTAADGKREWTKLKIDDTFSQVHALVLAKLDPAREPELITGKRVYAHEVEPGDTAAPVILCYRFDRPSKQWLKRTIFRGESALNAPKTAKDRWALKDFPRGSAGTGLQMAAVDIDGDGDLDLVCPGKSGLYLFENLGR